MERMSRVVLRAAYVAQEDPGERTRIQRRAAELLKRAQPLILATTASGEADLSHISMLLDMQLQVLATDDFPPQLLLVL